MAASPFTDLASMSVDVEGVLEFVGRWGKLVPRNTIAGGLRTVGDYYSTKIFVAGALSALTPACGR
jgi:hypothetical protein